MTTKGVDGRPLALQIETTRPYPAGTTLTLAALRGTYADASLNSDTVLLAPLGLAVAAAAW